MGARRSPTSQGAEARAPATRTSLAWLLLAVGGITLPFIYKAFHLDDTIFIRLAQQMLRDPLAPGLADHGFGGDFFPLYIDTHPPLIAGYLAVLLKLFGGASEAGLHLGFIIFPALAAVAMFWLARRFTDSPLTAALLLVVTPGFMVMSESIMTDIPALALWLAAIAAFIYAVDGADRRLLLLATVFLTLAVWTTYQSFSLIPLLLLYILLKRRATAVNLAPLAAALTAFGGIFLFYYLATGGPPKLSYSIGLNLDPDFIANKILSSVSVIGGAIVFPLVLVAGLLKGKKEYAVFSALCAAILLYFFSRVSSGQYTVIAAILQAVFYSAGILTIYRIYDSGADAIFPRSGSTGASTTAQDNIFLILWIGGVLVYNILLLPYASTRYLLPLFPPVILMFVGFARS
ncbi:MAG: ArnT family glycosyltransferase, partial [Thermoleophilia bacterium]